MYLSVWISLIRFFFMELLQHAFFFGLWNMPRDRTRKLALRSSLPLHHFCVLPDFEIFLMSRLSLAFALELLPLFRDNDYHSREDD